jgi:hypothetical protein
MEMPTLKFTSIQPGLILMPHWPYVTKHNPGAHTVGTKYSITFGSRDYELGVAEIISCTTIKVRQISDTLSCYLTGNPSYYLQAILRKKYPQDFDADMLIDLVVFKYIKRRIPFTQECLGRWWDHQIEQQPDYKTQLAGN